MAVPKANKEEFIQAAKIAAAILKENGALEVVDCWGDDIPTGKLTSMPQAVQAKPDEEIVFSWATWPDKATRDAGNKVMMADPRMQESDLPFDGKRAIFGGFTKLEY